MKVCLLQFSGALGAIMNWVLDLLPYVKGSTKTLISVVIPRCMMDLLIIGNSFKPNGISLNFQLDQSISVLRVARWHFSFLFNFQSKFCKQTVESLIKCLVLRRLIWYSTVCLCPKKGMLKLMGNNAANQQKLATLCQTKHNDIYARQ